MNFSSKKVKFYVYLLFIFSFKFTLPTSFAQCVDTGDGVIDGNADTISCTGTDSDGVAAQGGNDTISINGTVTGTDTIVESVNGGDGDDSIVIQAGATVDVWVEGGSGDDTIINNTVNDVPFILGRDGNDSLVNNGVGYNISADSGNDTILNTGSLVDNPAPNIVNVGISGFGTGDNSITNDGTINTGLHGVSLSGNGSSTLNNNGDIASISQDGVRLQNGTYLVNNATGATITSNGGEDVDEGISFLGTGTGTVNNDGSITGYEGIDASATTGDVTVNNTGNGTITGTVGPSILLGSGNDLVNNAGLLDGAVRTGDGNDTITISGMVTGTDTIIDSVDGGNGDDSIVIQAGATVDVWVEGGFGDDTIINNTVNDVPFILGRDGNDSLVNNGVAYTISADSGNDTILNTGSLIDNPAPNIVNVGISGFGTGDNSVTNDGTINTGLHGVSLSGNGSSTLNNNGDIASISQDGVRLQNGTYLVNNATGATITSNGGEDVDEGISFLGTGTGTVNNDGSITGYEGIDASGTTGNVRVNNTGNGTITGTAGVSVLLGSGNDTVTNAGLLDGSVDTGDGNDLVDYSAGGTVQNGVTSLGNGNDTFVGGTGNDSVNAGEGNDLITTSATGNTSVDAGNGDDTVNSNGGADSIQASGGNDRITLSGNHASSVIDAGTGSNTFVFQAGVSGIITVIGSVNDTLDFSQFTTPINLDLNNITTPQSFGALTIRLGTLFANVIGTTGNDSIVGNANPNNIQGLDGNDTLLGGGGNDVLSGGDGDDSIDGEDGNDVIFAGDGTDTVSGGGGSNFLNGGNGFDGVVEGCVPNNVLLNTEDPTPGDCYVEPLNNGGVDNLVGENNTVNGEGGGNPDLTCHDLAKVKLFRLPNGDYEIFGGFEVQPSDGFFIALIRQVGIAHEARFSDNEIGWYVQLNQQAEHNYQVDVYNENGSLVSNICHVNLIILQP